MRRALICLMLLSAQVLLLTPVASAFPPWRRRSSSTRYRTYSSGGYKRLPSRVDRASARYRRLGVSFDYNKALAAEERFQGRLRVHLNVYDKKLAAAKEPVVAEVKLTDLTDEKATHTRYIPVSMTRDDKKTSGLVEIRNDDPEKPLVQPARVYRVFVNLHKKSDKYGADTVIGRVQMPYYTASAGANRVDCARQKIVLRTFKEYYYRKTGRRSGERYSIDCYAYYMWATGFCTKGAVRNRTVLGRLFRGKTPFQSGSSIAKTAKGSAIHGDYVRKPGHSFMLLAYNPKSKTVWTMEGNFNKTIEVVVRRVSSGWTVGHLRDEHIRQGMFESGTAE